MEGCEGSAAFAVLWFKVSGMAEVWVQWHLPFCGSRSRGCPTELGIGRCGVCEHGGFCGNKRGKFVTAKNALIVAAANLGSRVDRYNRRMKNESGGRKSLPLVEESFLAQLDSFKSAYRAAHGQPPAALDHDDSDDEEDGGDDDDDGGDGDGDGAAAAAGADGS
ncbi:MAG: hypothetical protein M1816_007034 [Peltula sp. TS41687]|nr:MAG: hypothetical protein M1816_007034 [Peltula sp. TS41687]